MNGTKVVELELPLPPTIRTAIATGSLRTWYKRCWATAVRQAAKNPAVMGPWEEPPELVHVLAEFMIAQPRSTLSLSLDPYRNALALEPAVDPEWRDEPRARGFFRSGRAEHFLELDTIVSPRPRKQLSRVRLELYYGQLPELPPRPGRG